MREKNPCSILVGVALLATAACGTDGPARMLAPDASPADAAPGDGGPPSDAAAEASLGCVEGNRLSCACTGDQVGVRVCSGGAYGACGDCMDPSGELLCVEGYYEGTAVGTYRASGFFGELIAPFDTESDTRIVFSLEKKGSGEFYTLGDACVHVTPPDAAGEEDVRDAAFWLTGQVNCLTGLLDGEMRGYHWNGDPGSGQRYFYKGKILGRFDPDTQSFVDTAYKIIERPVLLGDPAGGQGTWTAELQDGDAPADAEQTIEACLGEKFPADDAFDDVEL